MIKAVSGDILLTKAEALVHGIAPNDDFKQGLALSLREQWPSMYKDFRHFCHAHSPEPGSLWSWKGPSGPAIVSLFTQEPPTQHGGHAGKARVEWVGHSLKALRKEIQTKGFKSVALPKLATGVGGLDWDTVKPLLEKNLSDAGIKVYVYETYRKGQAADEH